MPHRNDEDQSMSRRLFLKQMGWAPVLFLPAPIASPLSRSRARPIAPAQVPSFSPVDVRLSPHYPTKYPLDDVLRQAAPGTDEYVTEGYAAELLMLLQEWSKHLKVDPPAIAVIRQVVDPAMQSTALVPVRQSRVRQDDRIEVLRREFAAALVPGRDRFLEAMKTYLAPLGQFETADFEIYECKRVADSPLTLESKVRYDFVGKREDNSREERIGSWVIQWSRNGSDAWRILQWSAAEETVSRAAGRYSST